MQSLAWRIKIGTCLLADGIPFHKLSPKNNLGKLLGPESGNPSFGGKKGVDAVVPEIVDRTFKNYEVRLKDKKVSVMFDGSKILHNLEGTLVLFVEDYEIRILVIGFTRVEKSVSGAEIQAIVMSHLNRVGIRTSNVIFLNSDRA